MARHEGLHRIAKVFEVAAWSWACICLLFAIAWGWPKKEAMPYLRQVALYESETGHKLDTSGVIVPIVMDAFQAKFGDSPQVQAERAVLDDYFKGRKLEVNHYDMDGVASSVILGMIGFLVLWAVGWVVSGFAA